MNSHLPGAIIPPYVLVELHEIGVHSDDNPNWWPGPQEWPYCPRVGEFVEFLGNGRSVSTVRYRVVEIVWVVHVDSTIDKRRTAQVMMERVLAGKVKKESRA